MGFLFFFIKVIGTLIPYNRFLQKLLARLMTLLFADIEMSPSHRLLLLKSLTYPGYVLFGTQIMGLLGLITNVGCGDLNENGLCQYIYLNTWDRVGRTI